MGSGAISNWTKGAKLNQQIGHLNLTGTTFLFVRQI